MSTQDSRVATATLDASPEKLGPLSAELIILVDWVT